MRGLFQQNIQMPIPSDHALSSSSILDKPRLFAQLGMPACHAPARLSWTRSADFFGDGFKLIALVNRETINARWIHTSPAGIEQTIWSLTLDQSTTGRARVLSCEGFSPPLRSVQRAAEAIRLAIFQTQASPLIELSPKGGLLIGSPLSAANVASGKGARAF